MKFYNLHPYIKGAICALSAAIMLSCMNALAKILGSEIGPIDITFYRNAVSLVFLIGILVFIKKLSALKTERIYAHLIRAVIGTTALVLIMWSFILMPLSVATSLHFTTPLFVTLLSYPLLREKVSLQRIAIVILGFGGVLIIAQPENNIEPLALSVGLAAGFMNALVAICLRWLGKTESSTTTTFYFLFFGLVGTAFFMPFVGKIPSTEMHHIILLIGVVGLASLLVKTQGFKYAPAAVISPISYTMIIWTLMFDYFLWDNKPSLSLILGASVIILSNLYMIWRDSKRNKT